MFYLSEGLFVRMCLYHLDFLGRDLYGERGMGDEEPQHHHCRLCATPTSRYRSLVGFSVEPKGL